MRKQGIMKRVLGGIMAVAFGAALCFAAPVKAEAATPWTAYVEPNEAEKMAVRMSDNAYWSGVYAQMYASDMQDYLAEQLGAQVNVMQTTAATKQYLATLGMANQLASTLPQPYAYYLTNEINLNYYNLRNQAIDYIDGENLYAAQMGWYAERARLNMLDQLGRQQMWLVGSQAAAYAGAVDRAITAQQNALIATARGMNSQITAAYQNIWNAMGWGESYGF